MALEKKVMLMPKFVGKPLILSSTDCKQAIQWYKQNRKRYWKKQKKKVLKFSWDRSFKCTVLLLQEAQQEIKSTVTVNTTDMTSRSETKDGTKETEKEHHPFSLQEEHVFCSFVDPGLILT
jgi:hypothetical protein